jgi:hypothetical protein
MGNDQGSVEEACGGISGQNSLTKLLRQAASSWAARFTAVSAQATFRRWIIKVGHYLGLFSFSLVEINATVPNGRVIEEVGVGALGRSRPYCVIRPAGSRSFARATSFSSYGSLRGHLGRPQLPSSNVNGCQSRRFAFSASFAGIGWAALVSRFKL